MTRILMSVSLAASLAALATFAAAPVPHLPEVKHFQGLVEEMGARGSEERDRAERKLAAAGDAAIPYLRQAVRHADPEVRKRALRILPGLEHARLVAPRRFNLKVTDQPLEAVLASLAKATGYRIDSNRPWGVAAPPGKVNPKARYTYDFKGATFWEMADRICRDAGLVVHPSYGDDVIRLHSSTAVPLFTGVSGSFRYASGNFQMYRNVDLSAADAATPPARTESLSFNFTLNAEPKLPILGSSEAQLEAAFDDQKKSMLPAPGQNEEGPMGNPWGGPVVTRRHGGSGQKQLVVNVSVPLGKASPEARALKLLRGTVPVTLLVEQRVLEVHGEIQKAAGKKKELEGIEFDIHEVKSPAAGQYQVRMTVTNRANPSDYAWMNTLHQRVVLWDDNGKQLQNFGSSWGGGPGMASVQITMTFGPPFNGKGGKPTRLTYEHWVTTQHDVRFEFRNVPLP